VVTHQHRADLTSLLPRHLPSLSRWGYAADLGCLTGLDMSLQMNDRLLILDGKSHARRHARTHEAGRSTSSTGADGGVIRCGATTSISFSLTHHRPAAPLPPPSSRCTRLVVCDSSFRGSLFVAWPGEFLFASEFPITGTAHQALISALPVAYPVTCTWSNSHPPAPPQARAISLGASTFSGHSQPLSPSRRPLHTSASTPLGTRGFKSTSEGEGSLCTSSPNTRL
jgi:hypothetical protein